ncbi:DUF1972 domain-containing protein [Runella limosa]|uniref:DUF1972 domain-containing protein n=1 Tax=Runella limosa TaxID=370978 RepID=UPI00040A82EC|nr:DUF1972 domain-containing protein [Runella limosa]
MKIAILGTRGIPNCYGGFEQFAEYLSEGLVNRGHLVTVYNSHSHPYQQSEWHKVRIVHCYDPEDKFGTIGQFIYDFNCIRHTRTQDYDIILQLGYTSSTIWGWLLPRKTSIVTTNMDGLEWSRSKYSKPVQKFLQFAEYLGIKFSDYLISDSIGIKEYLKKKYKIDSTYIPYGAFVFEDTNISILSKYNLETFGYDMLIARLEPENNIEMILEGVKNADTQRPFLVIGKHESNFGTYLKNKFRNNKNIHFLGGIYDINILNNLRFYSNLYFHGHSVGGTNPSLLEAMASHTLICAHNNIFNSSILGEDAFYFSTSYDIRDVINTKQKVDYSEYLASNCDKIKEYYSWDTIIAQYLHHFNSILKTSSSRVAKPNLAIDL